MQVFGPCRSRIRHGIGMTGTEVFRHRHTHGFRTEIGRNPQANRLADRSIGLQGPFTGPQGHQFIKIVLIDFFTNEEPLVRIPKPDIGEIKLRRWCQGVVLIVVVLAKAEKQLCGRNLQCFRVNLLDCTDGLSFQDIRITLFNDQFQIRQRLIVPYFTKCTDDLNFDRNVIHLQSCRQGTNRRAANLRQGLGNIGHLVFAIRVGNRRQHLRNCVFAGISEPVLGRNPAFNCRTEPINLFGDNLRICPADISALIDHCKYFAANFP